MLWANTTTWNLSAYLTFFLPLVTQNQLDFKKIVAELFLFSAFNKTVFFIKSIGSIVIAQNPKAWNTVALFKYILQKYCSITFTLF